MANLSPAEQTKLVKEFVAIADKQIEESKITSDIQTRTGKALSTKAKRVVFAQYMTELAPIDYARCKRHIDCIDKTTTQRYLQGLKEDTKLSKKIKIRTANRGLVRKGIATQEQVDQKNVYHVFEFPVKPTIVLTNEEKIQKDITDGKVTEQAFKKMKFNFHVPTK
jgi:hypothetical protein